MKLIDTDLVQRVLYSTDISLYEIIPSGVATPKNEEEVKTLIDLCTNTGLSITARGSGTSTAGQAIGSGIIIDYSKHMNSIIAIEKDYVDVQPGIILAELNKELESHGLVFPVDPSSMDVCTIGGMVGNNSSGIHSFLYGDTKDYVIGLEGFWADGKFFSTITGLNVDGVLQKLLPFRQKADDIKHHLPQTSKNSSGYNVLEAFSKYGISLNHLVTGSEGTLCILTKIRLKTIPLPQKRITVLSLFDDLEKALEAVKLSSNINGLSAIELLDHELIDTTRKHFPELTAYFADNVMAGLLFEIDGNNDFVQTQFVELEKLLSYLAIKTEYAEEVEKRKSLWWFRKSASSILNRIQGSTRSLRFIEDVAVPFDKIIEFYRAEKKILDEYGLRTAFFGHVGSGHFHINPRIDTRDPGSQRTINEIGKKTYSLVKRLGGTFSAEHGDGVLREPYIKELQPELYSLFTEIKETLDHAWILNPGKIVSRTNKQESSRYNFKQHKDISSELLNAVEKCHGCNDCVRFCKAYLRSKNSDEGCKARGRANIMRNIVSGIISAPKDIKKAVRYLEKCHLCGKCLLECPTGVDLLETASLLREHGLIAIPAWKKLSMRLLSPLRTLLKHEVDVVKTNGTLKVNRIFDPVFRLGLYYKPYTREILKLIKDKNISISLSDKDLQRYLTLNT